MVTFDEPAQSLIVSFQNRSYALPACSSNDDILEQIRQRTGWPVQHLIVSVAHQDVCTVRVRSAIRGGKGGFGTLLKGQARQAGAKTTIDFGSCRDLQGRRLASINDQLAYEQYQTWQDKVDRGLATKQEMAAALLKTDSGIAGWHLQTPTWAAGSFKAHGRQLRRQFYHWRRQQQAEAEEKEKARAMRERQVQSYLSAAENASKSVTEAIQSAVKEGLEQQAKRQRVEQPEPPMALLTLTGEVDIAMDGHWKIGSESNFATLGILLANSAHRNRSATLYYEVEVVEGGLVQIGWASAAQIDGKLVFQPDSDAGTGVGDDNVSYGFDGSRQIKLHGESTTEYGRVWSKGDVIGCCYQALSGEMSFSLNGEDLGVAFTASQPENGHFPALSLNPGQVVGLLLHKNEFRYAPAGVVAVGDVLADDDNEPVEDDQEDTVVEVEPKPMPEPPKEPNPPPKPLLIEPLDLSKYESAQQLEAEGLERLKGALMAIGVKCGGTLQERAARLFSLKGLSVDEYPKKLLAKRKR